MIQINNVLTDRGSKYAVSGGAAASREEAAQFVKTLCRNKKYAKATHHSWGLILQDGTQIKNDDGESGAGLVILRMLEREGLRGEIIVVTRWYGGVKLGGDRFRRIQDCVAAYIAAR